MKNIFGIKKLLIAGMTLTLSAFALVSFGQSASVEASSCVKGSKYTDFTGYVTGKDTLTIKTKDGKKLCNDVKVNFASFVIHNDYNGQGFSKNPTALPQSQYYLKTVTLKKGTTGKTTVTVSIPDECTNYQIDAYLGKVQTKITTSEGFIGTNAITSKLYQKTKDDCSVPKVKACNMTTGAYEMVESGKENTPPYTTNFDYCETTKVCNTETRDIVTVTKQEAKDEKYTTNFDECETAKVCNTDTGKIVTVTKEEAKDSKYADTNDEACNPPKEIPSTGPADIISGIAGVGSLAGASSMYIRSRRALRR